MVGVVDPAGGPWMFTCVSVGHGFLPGGGMTGVLEPRMAPGGKTGPAPFPLLITPPQRVA